MAHAFDPPDQRLSVVMWGSTYTDQDDYCAALRALGVQSRPPDEVVIVVDNHSIEPAIRSSQEVPSVPLVFVDVQRRTPDYQELSDLHAGLRAASGDIVLFLAADASPHKGWVEGHLSCFLQPSVVAAYGPMVPSWHLNRPTWLPDRWLWALGFSTGKQAVLPASNTSYRRHPLLGIGGIGSGLDANAFANASGSAVAFSRNAIVRRRIRPHQTSMLAFAAACRSQGRVLAAGSDPQVPRTGALHDVPGGKPSVRETLRLTRASNGSRETYPLRQRCASAIGTLALLIGFIGRSLLH